MKELGKRIELGSYTLQMTAAVLRGLRVQVDELEQRLAAEEDDVGLRASVAETARAVERLWRFLRDAGVEPVRDVLPPEFAGEAPVIVVEAAPPGDAGTGTETAAAAAAAAVAAPEPARPAVVVTAARWAGRVSDAQAVRMRALADGAPDGTPATFRVFVRGDERAIGFVEGAVHGGAADAVWSFSAGVLAALEPRAEHALFFAVEIAGASAASDLLPAGALS